MPNDTTSMDGKSNGRPKTSGDTGPGRMLETPSKKTGTERGVTASMTSLPVSLQTALAGDNPDQTDKALRAALPPQLRSLLDFRWTRNYDATAAVVWINPPTAEIAAIAGRLSRAMNLAFRPPNPAKVAQLLSRLRMVTKSRPEDSVDLEATFQIYTEECLAYPADVVYHVLQTQKGFGIFWPAWAELQERLELHTSLRKRLKFALEHPPRPVAPPAPRVSAEELDALMERVRGRPKPQGPPLEETDLEAEKKRFDEQMREAMENPNVSEKVIEK